MQRLSIDSSASKLHGYNSFDDSKRKDYSASPSSSSSSPTTDYDDHDVKDMKPRRLSLQSPLSPVNHKPEKLIHFIPVLTLLCFIVLYLSSHTPSDSDLAQFNGFQRHSKHIDSGENGDVSGLIRADALAIRSSIRNLQDTEKFPARSLPTRHRTSHRIRKIADF